MCETETLQWAEVESIASSALSVFCDGSELQWGAKAWEMLVKAGLAGYSDEVGRCRAYMRLLSLAGIYRDFHGIVLEEEWTPSIDYEDWVYESDVDRYRVGQLIGPDFAGDFAEALEHLADAARSEIAPVINAGFGGDAMLFVALWRTRYPPELDRAQEPIDSDESASDSAAGQLQLGLSDDEAPDRDEAEYSDDDDDDEAYETDWEILNEDTTPEKVDAYDWIRQGCPAYF